MLMVAIFHKLQFEQGIFLGSNGIYILFLIGLLQLMTLEVQMHLHLMWMFGSMQHLVTKLHMDPQISFEYLEL